MQGWVSFHRKIEEWEWYDDANTFRLFFHLVLKANHKDNKWRGIDIKRGELVTSNEQLAKQLKLTVSKIRTSLNKLKSTGEIAIKTTNKNTVVTVANYDLYQSEDGRIADKTTNKSQTNRKQIATNNNDNNNNNENNKEYLEFFEECWKLYPSKKGKGQISDSKKKEVFKIGDEFKKCIQRYRKYVEGSSWIKYQNGSTFFNSGYIDYLDSNYQDDIVTEKTDTTGFIDLDAERTYYE